MMTAHLHLEKHETQLNISGVLTQVKYSISQHLVYSMDRNAYHLTPNIQNDGTMLSNA